MSGQNTYDPISQFKKSLGSLSLIFDIFVDFNIFLINLRYFDAPVDEVEASEQSILLEKILNESITFHFWNSSTFSLVPQVGSLSEKLINRYCLRCNDVL